MYNFCLTLPSNIHIKDPKRWLETTQCIKHVNYLTWQQVGNFYDFVDFDDHMYWTKGVKFSEFNIMTLSEISRLLKEFDQSDDAPKTF